MKEAEVNGYLEGGTIMSNEHKTLGFTPERIKRVVELLNHPKFLYTRWKEYGIQVYIKDEDSPTGVILAGGIPLELEFLIKRFQKFGAPLSPTEDLRTAR